MVTEPESIVGDPRVHYTTESIKTVNLKITAGGASVKGPHRKQNEDAFRIYQEQAMVRRAGRGAIFAVADGVGGTGTGRFASWHVVDSLALFFNLPDKRFAGGKTLKDILTHCNKTLIRMGEENHSYYQAGTTLALLYASPKPGRGFMIGIGDSGVFVLHKDQWMQLNEDHRNERGKVTSCVGIGEKMTVSSRTIRFFDGDVYLLCTDGVRDMLPDDTIRALVDRKAHPHDIATDLVNAAEEAGGKDNATAIVLRIGDCPARRTV
ncbi:MAG: serine/threonine protein phosphatase PrpC [Myxococcota bacterium]